MNNDLITIGKFYFNPLKVAAMFVDKISYLDGTTIKYKYALKVVLDSGVALQVFESAEEGNCLSLIDKNFKFPKKGMF